MEPALRRSLETLSRTDHFPAWHGVCYSDTILVTTSLLQTLLVYIVMEKGPSSLGGILEGYSAIACRVTSSRNEKR